MTERARYDVRENLTPLNVTVDLETGTLRPQTAEGDRFYGLEPGTNGTAATTRRALVEHEIAGFALAWLRHDGRQPIGITLVPTDAGDDAFQSPWVG